MKNSISSLIRKFKPGEVGTDPLGIWGTPDTGKYLTAEFEGYEVLTQSPNSNLLFLEECAKGIYNGKVVEVGVFGGYLSLNLAKILKGNQSQVYSVDIWEDVTIDNGNMTYRGEVHPDYLDDAQHFFKNMRFNYQNILKELGYDHVSVIQKPSLEAVDLFENNDIDLVFIDSDHSTEHVLKELNAWHPKLKQNGTMAGDDLGDARVDAALTKFCNENDLTMESSDGRFWRIQ